MLSPLGAPCNRPPWGALVAIDLKSRKRLWEVPLGTTRDLAPFPLWFELGVPNIGGPVITASGLVFIGAATDNYLRAFDLRSGKLLWKGRLPAGPQATPMTYRVRPDGRQYVVIAAGGHKYLGTTPGRRRRRVRAAGLTALRSGPPVVARRAGPLRLAAQASMLMLPWFQ